jgi:hypothetical protein
LAQQATLTFGTPTVGSYSNIMDPNGVVSYSLYSRKGSLFLYGEVPTTRSAVLAADANTGQKVIVTTAPTGWASGDTVYIGKSDGQNYGDKTKYTIDTVVGTTITLLSNIADYKRKAGGHVVRSNKYGIIVNRYETAQWTGDFMLLQASNICISGVSFTNGAVLFPYVVEYSRDDNANLLNPQWDIENNFFGPCYGWWILYGNCPPNNFKFSNNHMILTEFPYIYTRYGAGVYTCDSNIILCYYVYVPVITCNAAIFTNNIIENGYLANYVPGAKVTLTGNSWWGGTIAPICFQNFINPVAMGGNKFNNCAGAYDFQGGYMIIGCNSKDDIFGDEVANTLDVAIGTGAYIDFEFNSPTTLSTIQTAAMPNTIPGSHLRISDNNNIANVDLGYLTYGNFVRCGDGLGDTTVRTTGARKFSIRFQPIHSTNVLSWKQTIPTGNIQNKTMNVNVWVKINNAAYYAGTHTKPTLRVRYDNATEITAVALGNTDWQQLNVSFTPTTTYGQIEVSVEGATDATTTNAYFYVDDMNVAFPAGVQVDLGGLDLWANALPVAPAIATMPALAGVWDELLAAHTVSGSFGKWIKDLVDKIWAEEINKYLDGAVASDAGNLSTTFKTDLTSVISDSYKGAFCLFISGDLENQVKRISGYNSSNKFLTVEGGFTGIPGNGDQFVLVNR